MAEALLGIVLGKLIPFVQSEFAAFFEIKEKAEELTLTLELIKAVIDDAEDKQWTNRPLKVWLQQLKNAMYVMDDILDQLTAESSQSGCLSSLNPKNMIHQSQLGKKLNKIIGRLDRIAQHRSNFVLRQSVTRERTSEVAEWRQTSPTITSPQVYGRDGDKEKVVEFLLSPTRGTEPLSVYPIVGLGGLGKTTLAQFVYNDERVSNHFNLKIWLCISENFDVTRILCSIVQSVTKDKCETLEPPVVEEKVKRLLQGKMFLLVLDDVWIKNQQMEFGLSQDKWDHLKSVLSCGSKGASILVSTRDRQVATIMGTYQAHDLSGISDVDCWSLFEHYAFTPDKKDDKQLVKIGKQIVSNCRGSPLAAKALGGLVRSKTREEWLMVKKSSLWNLPDEDPILRAMKLSYSYLTPTLKQCFTFCAIFPKDQRIHKQELILLWIANGFISSQGKLNAEEVGNRHWNELCQKSFFQDVEIDDNSGDVFFKMHDLVHDLAQSITEKECLCLEEANLTDLPRKTHHIGFSCDVNKTPFKKGACEKVESLRTLYHLGWRLVFRSKHSYFYPSNSSLRVLCIGPSKFPSLENFRQLRYLGLSGLDIKTIPDSIYSLHKLEILKLIDCEKLCRLPKHLTRLHNLRHLVIEDCDSLSEMCPDIRKLPSLQQLIVDNLPNVERLLKRETANMFPSLSTLVINHCPKLQLPCLPRVKDLTVSGCSSELLRSISNLNGLNTLHLHDSRVSCFPEGMMSNMTSLATLRISLLGELKELPSDFTKLTALSYLRIFGCNMLECLPEEGFEDLCSLRSLSIEHCEGLRWLPEGVRQLTSLESLRIKGCRTLIERCKEGTGEDWPKIAHIPDVHIPQH